MDVFLESQGLWRKHIPRDASCLFRAVSEQVYNTQVYHLDVRRGCIQFLASKKDVFESFVDGNYEDYLANLSNPKVWAGHLEMESLSQLYRIEFAVFEEVGQVPTKITMNSFCKTILLCYSQGNHYDLIYRKDQLDSFAFCQALVYGLLYKDVFSLGPDVDYAVQKMLYDKAYSKKKKSLALPHYRTFEEKRDKCRIQDLEENPLEIIEPGDPCSNIRERLAQGSPPFPYKVAKALDNEIYRNVEFDHWNQARREQERAEQLVVPDFAPGVKCLVRLLENQMFHAHIQEMSPDHGPVTVYIEELGEKKIIPFEHLQPLAIPVYKALAMQGFNCKKSIRLLDGYLKTSPLMSLTTLVTDGLRNGRKYLKKKVKEVPFLLPMIDKAGNTWSPKSQAGTVNTISSWQLSTNKLGHRYLMDKEKVLSSTSKDEKQLQVKKTAHSETDGHTAEIKSKQSVGKLPSPQSHLASTVMVPRQPQGATTALPNVCMRVNSQQGGLLPAPPFSPPLLGPTPVAYPYFQPYPVPGPNSAVSSAPITPSTDFTEFAHDNRLINSGLALDPFGNPFLYTVGTCEVPFFSHPGEQLLNTNATNIAPNVAGEALAGLQQCTASGSTAPAGATELAPPQNSSYWAYNGSFTYLPLPSSPVVPEGYEWTFATDDPNTSGFAAMSPGVPLFFFMSPPTLNPGLVNNPPPYLPNNANM